MEVLAGAYDGTVLGFKYDSNNANDKEFELDFSNQNHIGSVRALAASTSGHYFASGSTDETIRLYNISKRIELGTLMAHNGTITCLKFVAKSHLLSAAEDGVLTIWKCKSWECLKNLKGHKLGIIDLAVHPSAKLALTSSQDKTLRMWNLVTGRQSYIIKCPEEVSGVHWSPCGQLYATIVKNVAYIYDIKTASCVHKLDFQHRIISLRFLSSSELLVAEESNTLKIQNIDNANCVHQVKQLPSRVKSLDVCFLENPTAVNIVAALSDGHIKMWQYESDKVTEIASEKVNLRLTSVSCLQLE